MRIDWLPAEHPLAPTLHDLAEDAARRLELARHLEGLTLCLDDLAEDERVWISFAAPPRDRNALPAAAGHGQAAPRPHRCATIYCHPGDFCKDRALTASPLAAAMPWQLGAAPPQLMETAADVSARKAERFFYHQFLLLRDLCDGTVTPGAVPPELAEAFQEAWSVTLDGRLRRALLPGYSQAERRRRFFRVFSAGGILLPQHWQIFHMLWEWERLEQDRLQEILRRLPQPRGARGRVGRSQA